MYRGSCVRQRAFKPYCQAEKRLHGSQYRPFDTGSCKADPNLERTTLQAKHTPSGGAPSLLSSSKVPSENLTSRMIGPAVVLLENGQNIRVSLNFTSTLSTLRKKRSNTYQHLGMTRTCIAHGIHTVALTSKILPSTTGLDKVTSHSKEHVTIRAKSGLVSRPPLEFCYATQF